MLRYFPVCMRFFVGVFPRVYQHPHSSCIRQKINFEEGIRNLWSLFIVCAGVRPHLDGVSIVLSTGGGAIVGEKSQTKEGKLFDTRKTVFRAALKVCDKQG